MINDHYIKYGLKFDPYTCVCTFSHCLSVLSSEYIDVVYHVPYSMMMNNNNDDGRYWFMQIIFCMCRRMIISSDTQKIYQRMLYIGYTLYTPHKQLVSVVSGSYIRTNPFTELVLTLSPLLLDVLPRYVRFDCTFRVYISLCPTFHTFLPK